MQSVFKLPATQITVTSTAQTLDQLITTAAGSDYSILKDANAVDIQVESESIRFLVDGNTPTASVGFLLSATGVSIKQFRGEEVGKIKLIRGGASDATVNIQIGRINPN